MAACVSAPAVPIAICTSLTGNVGRTAVISIAGAVLIIRCSVTRPDGIVYMPSFNLKTPLGFPLQPSDCYQPVYDGPHCKQCGSRRICNGCSHCGKCRR